VFVNDAAKKLLLIGTAIIGLGMIAQAQQTQEERSETAPFEMLRLDTLTKEKPKKDAWDKADIIAKGLIGLASAFAAIFVVYMGGRIQKTITNQTVKTQESIATQNTGKDYVQIALRILEQKDLREDMKKNIGLRKWAVSLLKYYSPVTLDDSTADKLINGDVEIPFTAPAPWRESEWGPPDPNAAFQAIAPHGFGFASLNTDGVLRIRTRSARYTYPTEIKSPRGLFFSEDGVELVVYNNQTFAIFSTVPDTIRGRPHVSPPIQISPPNGISTITFNPPYGRTLMVTGTDNKQISYDSEGNEVKQ
jgi:hypothetical protein